MKGFGRRDLVRERVVIGCKERTNLSDVGAAGDAVEVDSRTGDKGSVELRGSKGATSGVGSDGRVGEAVTVAKTSIGVVTVSRTFIGAVTVAGGVVTVSKGEE